MPMASGLTPLRLLPLVAPHEGHQHLAEQQCPRPRCAPGWLLGHDMGMKHLPVLGDLGATLLTPDAGGHAALPRATSAVGSPGNPFAANIAMPLPSHYRLSSTPM